MADTAPPGKSHLTGKRGSPPAIRRGNRYAFTWYFWDDEAKTQKEDWSGETSWLCQLRSDPESDIVLATFGVTVANLNEVTITLAKADTDDLAPTKTDVWDIVAGDAEETLLEGEAWVLPDVSRA